MNNFGYTVLVAALCLCLMNSGVFSENESYQEENPQPKTGINHILQALSRMSNAENEAFWSLLSPSEKRFLLAEIIKQNYEIDSFMKKSPNPNGNPNGNGMMCHFKICNLGKRRRYKEETGLKTAFGGFDYDR